MTMFTPGPARDPADDGPVRPQRRPFADDDHARRDSSRLVRRALVSYVLASVGVLLVVGLGASVIAGRVAVVAAVDDAAVYTQQFSKLVVAPYVTQQLVDGDPAAVAGLDRVVRQQMSQHEVLRVKVWSADGVVLYSDEPRLLGRIYPVDEDDRPLLSSLGVEAEISPSTKPENEFEAGFGQTLEVYAGIRAVNGDPVLVEAYLPIDRLDALRDGLSRQIIPLLMTSLLTLQLLLLPLAVVLARRIARHQQERDVLSRLAAHAAEAERHSIAAELHDGVIQDLVAVGFGLDTVRAVAERAGQADVGAAAQQLNDILREDVRVLRGMITSLAVRDVADRPLHEVVLEAAAEAERSGLTVVRDVAVVAPPARDVHTAVCLVVREAVRNAVRHAHADTLTLRLTDERDDVVLEVVDDGQGFEPATATTAQDGHLGLTLYRHAARTTGGTSSLDTGPGTGTRLVFRAPRDRSAGLRRHRH